MTFDWISILNSSRTGKLKVPIWVDLVKGGAFNELAPVESDWFYTRCASIARHLYIRRAGVGAFTKVYGGKFFLFLLDPSQFTDGVKKIFFLI